MLEAQRLEVVQTSKFFKQESNNNGMTQSNKCTIEGWMEF